MRLRRPFVVQMISILVSFALLLTQGCRGLESQTAVDIFATGRLPKSLTRLSNQDYELRAKEKEIVERVQKDAQNPNILNVAVIDNGIDLAHPDLINQIAFDVQDGKVVGAGYDFMGGDRWASSNLISSKLFAFGAQKIEKGLIYGELESPLKTLQSMNSEFWAHLQTELRARPDLQSSLFSKINRGNFSIVGAYQLVEYEELTKETYEAYQKEGELIGPNSKEKLLEKSKIYGQETVKQIIESPWHLNPETGMPFETEYTLSRLEHADQFWEAMKAALAKTSIALPFGKAFQTYVDFVVQRNPDFDRGNDHKVKDLLEDISKALSFGETYRASADPLFELRADLRKIGYNDSAFKAFDKNSLFSHGNSEAENLKAALERLEKMMEFKVKKGDISPENERYLTEGLKVRGALREGIQWVLSERSLADGQKREALASAYRRYMMRANHPLLSGESTSSTHGSHVSGKIALAHHDVRILPVRVTTQTVEIARASLEKMKQGFKKDFQSWLAEPLVFKALGETLKSVYPEMDFSPEACTATVQELMNRLKKAIDHSFQEKGLEYKFLGEVQSALAFVGKRNIKLANISLGINFEKAPTSVRSEDQQFALERAYDFLSYEYFKYRIAQTIQAHAPQTLFVIASGNDGQWIDGQSRSALPVDISSPWLEEYQAEMKIEAPNNQMKNVLGVGSIDPKHRLSSFSNIPINLKTPFVLAEGESVLSAIKSTDTVAIDQIFAKALPELSSMSRFDIQTADIQGWIKEYLGDLPGLTEQERETIEANLNLNFSYNKRLLMKLVGVIKLHLFMKYPEHRARLTGTSMATPTVVEILSRMIMEKASRLGVNTRDIYNHPEFTPEKLIDDVFAKAEPLNKHARGISLSKLIGDKKQESSRNGKGLEAQINEFLMRGQEDNTLRIGDTAGISCRGLFSVAF